MNDSDRSTLTEQGTCQLGAHRQRDRTAYKHSENTGFFPRFLSQVKTHAMPHAVWACAAKRMSADLQTMLASECCRFSSSAGLMSGPHRTKLMPKHCRESWLYFCNPQRHFPPQSNGTRIYVYRYDCASTLVLYFGTGISPTSA